MEAFSWVVSKNVSWEKKECFLDGSSVVAASRCVTLCKTGLTKVLVRIRSPASVNVLKTG